MRCRTVFHAVAIAASILALSLVARAADDSATQSVGKVSGVVMKDGKPLANARVAIFQAPTRGQRKAARQQQAPATQPDDSTANNGDRPHRQVVAQTQADADGKFSLEQLKPGEYVVVAGAKHDGKGRQRVSVAAGQDSAVQINVQPEDGNGQAANPDQPQNSTHPRRSEKQRKKFGKLGL